MFFVRKHFRTPSAIGDAGTVLCRLRCYQETRITRLGCRRPSLSNFYLDQRTHQRSSILTGGATRLSAEWVPWMMQELRSKGLDRRVYLWSGR